MPNLSQEFPGFRAMVAFFLAFCHVWNGVSANAPALNASAVGTPMTSAVSGRTALPGSSPAAQTTTAPTPQPVVKFPYVTLCSDQPMNVTWLGVPLPGLYLYLYDNTDKTWMHPTEMTIATGWKAFPPGSAGHSYTARLLEPGSTAPMAESAPAEVKAEACLDCRGMPHGGASEDACGVCGGNNSTCSGCDGIPNSGKVVDECGVCGGSNQTCAGCDGVPNSGGTFDACGICGGKNETCAGCDGVVNSGKHVDGCGVCGGDNSTCAGCDGIPFSGSAVDSCGVCGGAGGCEVAYAVSAERLSVCKGQPIVVHWAAPINRSLASSVWLLDLQDPRHFLPGLGYSSCSPLHSSSTRGVCKLSTDAAPKKSLRVVLTSNGATQASIDVLIRESADGCGVCGGNNSTCAGCDNIPNSGKTIDACGTCGGNDNTCDDPFVIQAVSGSQSVSSEFCTQTPLLLNWTGPSNHTENVFAACFIAGGFAVGIIQVENGSSGTVAMNLRDNVKLRQRPDSVVTLSCHIIELRGSAAAQISATKTISVMPRAKIDSCGVCNGTNSTCLGCDNVPMSGKIVDACGQCGGDNSTCTGCDGVLFSGSTNDACGVCGGDNSTCVGCDGIVNSGKVIDDCGDCGGPGGCGVSFTLSLLASSRLERQVCSGSRISAKWSAPANRSSSVIVAVQSAASRPNLLGICEIDEPPVTHGICVLTPQAPATAWPQGVVDLLMCLENCITDGAPLATVSPVTIGPPADACGACGGDGLSCAGCDGVPNSGKAVDSCGVCGGHCDDAFQIVHVTVLSPLATDGKPICKDSRLQIQWTAPIPRNGTTRIVAINDTPGSTEFGSVNEVSSALLASKGSLSLKAGDLLRQSWPSEDSVLSVNISLAFSDGITFSRFSQRRVVIDFMLQSDACGVCGGNGSSCAGCDGVPNSGKVTDGCGMCGGDNACFGIRVNSSEVCVGSAALISWRLPIALDTLVFNASLNVKYNDNNVDGAAISEVKLTPAPTGQVVYSGPWFEKSGVYVFQIKFWAGSTGPHVISAEFSQGLAADSCHVCGGDGSSCAGCDGVPNSGKVIDSCGVCDGHNKTCTGCDGVVNSGLTTDACGECGGNNSTCMGCDWVPNSGLAYDSCGKCNGTDNTCTRNVELSWVQESLCAESVIQVKFSGPSNHSKETEIFLVQLQGPSQNPLKITLAQPSPASSTGVISFAKLGPSFVDKRIEAYYAKQSSGSPLASTRKPLRVFGGERDRCQVCGGQNSCLGCDNVPFSGKLIDGCGVCGGHNESCSGCDRIPFSGVQLDDCNVCGGNNSTCTGCDGIIHSGMVLDECGVCGGNNTTCGGPTVLQVSNPACADKTFNISLLGPFESLQPMQFSIIDTDLQQDVQLGHLPGLPPLLNQTQPLLRRMVSASVQVSRDQLSEHAVFPKQMRVDVFLQAESRLLYSENFDLSLCKGCDGVPNSGKAYDACNICGGNGATCAGCDGVPNSGKTIDLCGVCGGANESCTGCDGIVNSGKTRDLCGNCGGSDDSCVYPFQITIQGNSCSLLPTRFVWTGPSNATANITASFKLVSIEDEDSHYLQSIESGASAGSFITRLPSGVYHVWFCNGSACEIITNADGSATALQIHDCPGCDGILNSFKLFDSCGECGGNNTLCSVPYTLTWLSSLSASGQICLDQAVVVQYTAPFNHSANLVLKVCSSSSEAAVSEQDCALSSKSSLNVDELHVPPRTYNGTLSVTACNTAGQSMEDIDALSSTSGGTESGHLESKFPSNLALCVASSTKNLTIILSDTMPKAALASSTLQGHTDLCGICGGDNSSCKGCDGVPQSGKIVDACGQCGGDNSSCTGCDGVLFSGSIKDACGVCNGDNSTCRGCDDVVNSGKVVDDCGHCGGSGGCTKPFEATLPSGQICLDKPIEVALSFPVNASSNDAAVSFLVLSEGQAVASCQSIFDASGHALCVIGQSPSSMNCACNIDQKFASSMEANIGKTFQVWQRGKEENKTKPWFHDSTFTIGPKADLCGVCGGHNETCTGCDGVVLSGKVMDACGQCDGDNSTCAGCDGVLGSGAEPDACGVCEGNNTLCLGCDGVVNSGKIFDSCGECGGENRFCEEPYSVKVFSTNPTTSIMFPASVVCPGATMKIVWTAPSEHGPDTSISVKNVDLFTPEDISSVTIRNSIHTGSLPIVAKQNSLAKPERGGLFFWSEMSSSKQRVVIQRKSDDNAVRFVDVEYNTNVQIDECGICGGDGSLCMGCDGVPNSGSVYDACNVCNGPGTSCLGCDGVPFGKVNDTCGVCDGHGETCTGYSLSLPPKSCYVEGQILSISFSQQPERYTPLALVIFSADTGELEGVQFIDLTAGRQGIAQFTFTSQKSKIASFNHTTLSQLFEEKKSVPYILTSPKVKTIQLMGSPEYFVGKSVVHQLGTVDTCGVCEGGSECKNTKSNVTLIIVLSVVGGVVGLVLMYLLVFKRRVLKRLVSSLLGGVKSIFTGRKSSRLRSQQQHFNLETPDRNAQRLMALSAGQGQPRAGGQGSITQPAPVNATQPLVTGGDGTAQRRGSLSNRHQLPGFDSVASPTRPAVAAPAGLTASPAPAPASLGMNASQSSSPLTGLDSLDSQSQLLDKIKQMGSKVSNAETTAVAHSSVLPSASDTSANADQQPQTIPEDDFADFQSAPTAPANDGLTFSKKVMDDGEFLVLMDASVKRTGAAPKADTASVTFTVFNKLSDDMSDLKLMVACPKNVTVQVGAPSGSTLQSHQADMLSQTFEFVGKPSSKGKKSSGIRFKLRLDAKTSHRSVFKVMDFKNLRKLAAEVNSESETAELV